ncbi:protein TolR [Oceanibaculum nanhaiense]|jgi:biopolymer transport protein TolR|uniref:protein TolR n=1 Tax=Oceanibaculum nanhaiense TaxID=1909734 RepID=UPI000A3A8C1A|nr:protein TolR [Oceanibaculum nanhaiense]MBC7134221.1 protein TolR [Oceanibaculum nanhaiense]MDM7947612.1 protein TolR [Oceanibaculum nanhaiense]
MGAKLGNGGGVGRRNNGRYMPMSEINVTPFVDVMLVLLIVFMVTAPLLTVGVPVDLPKTQASQLSDQVEPLVVTVNAEGRLFIQETETEAGQLVPRLQAITQNKPDTRIYVRGDQAINYGRVMEVMGLINSAGFTKVALIAEMPQEGRR